MEKQLCIVSHSHWDREWYLSHAQHNFRLVRFFDRLLHVLETDADFRSFHLDGQVIILNDYLAVRPEKEEQIKRYIREGRLKIGPFYILQDEYLISGEANIRNISVGLRECERYGQPSPTGYFPDAFGNIGQMPQILRGFGLDNAFFGRGIIPMGYANEVLGKTDDGYSEIIWEGVDGSEVIGVQFTNWYHNAMELETDYDACIERLQRIFHDSGVAARTPYLLGMNGCDHQPVQADLSKALAHAKKAGLNVTHCSLQEYMEKIRPYRDTFYRYHGEIEGQNGNGFGTLINTASSRVYLKQHNYRAQYLLETVAEPLSAVASSYGIAYDADVLYWIWKKLLQNHPHDSICGCGVDSVYTKMETRFNDVIDTAQSLCDDIGGKLVQKLCPPSGGVLAVNGCCFGKTTYASCDVDFPEGETVPKHLVLRGENGEEIPAVFENKGAVKVFSLPEDRFRRVYDVTRVNVLFRADIAGASCAVYRVEEGKSGFASLVSHGKNTMANDCIRVDFHANGTFDIVSLADGTTARRQNYFTEVGDKGNEYEFIRTGEEHDTLQSVARIRLHKVTALEVAFSVENTLQQQNGKLVRIKSIVSLRAGEPFVRVVTEFENKCENHRIRACFACDYASDIHRAAGQFDLTERPNVPGARWKNENNPQRAEAFIERIHPAGGGAFVALRGLNEYEVNRKTGATEITLVRGVGEMGDWFYFPTVDSQCLGICKSEYAVGVYPKEYREETLLQAYDYHRPPFVAFGGRGEGKTVASPLVRMQGVAVQSCLKRSEDGKGWIARVYNPFASAQTLRAEDARITDMRESESTASDPELSISPKKILTFRFGKKE